MTIGLLFLSLALVGFAAMGVLHKVGDRFRCQPTAVAAVAMSAGVVVAAARAASAHDGLTDLPAVVPAVAVPFGLLAAGALWAFQAGVRHGRISTSWLLLNLSVAIPVGLSVALYGEPIDGRRAVALGLIALAVVCVWWDRRAAETALPADRDGGAPCGSG